MQLYFVLNTLFVLFFCLQFLDPRCNHCIVLDWGVHWSSRSAWDVVEVHWAPDYHAHCGPHRVVRLPGCRREGWKTLGHCYAVSTGWQTLRAKRRTFNWKKKKKSFKASFHQNKSKLFCLCEREGTVILFAVDLKESIILKRCCSWFCLILLICLYLPLKVTWKPLKLPDIIQSIINSLFVLGEMFSRCMSCVRNGGGGLKSHFRLNAWQMLTVQKSFSDVISILFTLICTAALVNQQSCGYAALPVPVQFPQLV